MLAAEQLTKELGAGEDITPSPQPIKYHGKECWKNQRAKRYAHTNEYCKNRSATDPEYREKQRLKTLAWRKKNPEKEKANGIKKYQKIRVQYSEERRGRLLKNKTDCVNYLGGKCIDCGYENIIALTFHHRIPEDKSFAVSSLLANGWGLERLKEELDKCDLLCANCHIIRHSRLTGLVQKTSQVA